MKRTYLAPEEHAYPHGGQTRRCTAIFPDGKVRVVWGGIPDTFFSIPAHATLNGKYVKGWLGFDDKPESPDYGELVFHPSKEPCC